MHADRYLKAMLTVIAMELGWIALTPSAPAVSAQATATPVVITGIELKEPGFLPVGVMGQMRTVPARLAASFQPIDTMVRNERVAVSVPVPVDVRTVGPIKIEADKPLKVENVGYTPAQRPGE